MLQAQEVITKEALLNNKDITWVGEYIIKMPFDLNVDKVQIGEDYNNRLLLELLSYYWEHQVHEIYNYEYQKSLNLLRFRNDYLKRMDLKLGFSAFLVETVKNNLLTVYKDSDLKEAYSKEEIKNFGDYSDTIIILNSKTQEKEELINKVKLNVIDCRELGAKIYIYYNQKTFSWHLVCKSITIYINRYSNDNIDEVPLFWLPVYNYDSKLDYTQPQFTYTNKTTIGIKFLDDIENENLLNDSPLPQKSIFTQLKNSISFEKCNENMFEHIRNNASYHEIHNVFDDDYTTKLTTDEKKSVHTYIDSVFSKDPVTSKEIVNLVTKKLDASWIKILRFNQIWYWDNQEKKIKMTPLGFAPIVSRYDKKGNFLNSGILFWKKTYLGKDGSVEDSEKSGR